MWIQFCVQFFLFRSTVEFIFMHFQIMTNLSSSAILPSIKPFWIFQRHTSLKYLLRTRKAIERCRCFQLIYGRFMVQIISYLVEVKTQFVSIIRFHSATVPQNKFNCRYRLEPPNSLALSHIFVFKTRNISCIPCRI